MANRVVVKRAGWRCLLAASVLAAGRQLPARGEVTPDEVDAAVTKIVSYLKSKQAANGSWEVGARPKDPGDTGLSDFAKWGGETAIATYALCAADEGDSPEVKKAIDWLYEEDLHGTYATGLRCQVWPYVKSVNRTKAFDTILNRDKDFVLYSRLQKGAHKGFYGYVYGKGKSASLGAMKFPPIDQRGPAEGAWYDRSNSQYGVLGAWALDQAGAEIPSSYWKEEDEAWKKAQLTDGGWNYKNDDENSAPSYTMTAAGIATLFITQDYMLREGHQFDSCKGGVTNANIEKGLAWMDKHINQAIAKGGGFYYYGLYGIERIGVASGRKYFGTVDWYKGGAEAIVRGQGADGGYGSIHDSCFALLFLVRGRAPVMMNKLIYDSLNKQQVDPWNERPRDSANLAKWMGHHSVESFFNWQVVNLKVPVEELHDAPIMYISGSQELTFSDQEIAKLRTFVEEGGMILGNADCGSRAFSNSFRALGTKLFPKYEFRPLPKSHVIYNEQYHASKWRTHPVLEGMTNGVRELMLLVPEADPSRSWQTEAVKTQEVAYQLAGNIFLYATGRENLARKGATYIVMPQGEAGREIKVARIKAGDNWDPEPGGWRRLAAIMHNDQHVEVKPEPVALAAGSLSGYKIAHLTGTTRLILSDDARAELKKFVTGGGTLIVDAAGGSAEFADTAEAELKKIFGEAAAVSLNTPLSPDHPAISIRAKGDDKMKMYRPFVRQLLTGSLKDPRVRGIQVNGRMAVFYSREDITGGLVGEPVDGVLGYEPKAATALMQQLVQYAEKGSGGGTAAAAAASDASAK